jgi:acyl-CoA dehydrogenase
MRIEPTDEQKAYQERVARFAAEQVAPHAQAIDERNTFPRELVQAAAKLGLMGVTIPAEWGGEGRDSTASA